MKLQAIFIALAAVLIMTGCAAKTSDFLEEKPVIISPQKTGEIKNIPQLQEKSNQIFFTALKRYHWEIRDFNDDQHTITAEGCQQGIHCVEIIATIMADGSVSVRRTPDQDLTIEEGAMLKQWLDNLERQYQKDMLNVL